MTSQIKTTELPIASDADFDSSDFVLILDDGITKRLPRQEMIDNFLPFMQGEKGNTGATGIKGDKGDTGDRGLTGATGAQGIQGIQGSVGATGAQGDKGWSPILAAVEDGDRRVLQVSDWAGGQGTKPPSGSYIGNSGLVLAMGDAIDIRGIQGIQGLTGDTGAAGTDGLDGIDGADGIDGIDSKQINTITHEANNAIKTTFTDATFVTSDAPKKLTGWASYADSIYTDASPLSIANGVTATVNNNAATVINTYIPFGVTSFWNSATAKITPANAGDGYTFCLRCKIKPSSADTYLDFGVDVGGAVGVIFKQTLVLPKGAGIEHDINIECTGYSLATFVANGGIMKITAHGGTLSIYNIELQVHRYHSSV